MDKGGVSKRRYKWRRDLTTDDLRQPTRVQVLYEQAVAGGLLSGSADVRLAFFAWSRYCCRVAQRPPALFNAGLRKPDRYGQTWLRKPSAADEHWAQQAIASLRRPAESSSIAATLAGAFGEDADA